MTDRMTLEQVQSAIHDANGLAMQKDMSRIANQHADILEAFAAAGINDPWKLVEDLKAGEKAIVPMSKAPHGYKHGGQE